MPQPSPRPAPPRRPPLSLVPLDPPEPATAVAPPGGERPAGCGWFESSLDLRDGLLVQEHDQPDAVQAWLPWHWWLRWALDDGGPSIR